MRKRRAHRDRACCASVAQARTIRRRETKRSRRQRGKRRRNVDDCGARRARGAAPALLRGAAHVQRRRGGARHGARRGAAVAVLKKRRAPRLPANFACSEGPCRGRRRVGSEGMRGRDLGSLAARGSGACHRACARLCRTRSPALLLLHHQRSTAVHTYITGYLYKKKDAADRGLPARRPRARVVSPRRRGRPAAAAARTIAAGRRRAAASAAG